MKKLDMKVDKAYWNLKPAMLIEAAIKNGEGQLTHTGALSVSTGTFTGRSPKDRFIVKDKITKDMVWWGPVNSPLSPADFDRVYGRMMSHLENKQVYVRDMYAGADKTHRLGVRFVTTMSWHNLFCYNMFIQPEAYKLKDFTPDFTVVCCPEFKGDPNTEGIRKENFTIISFEKKMVLIGGTEYSGEIKKGIFSILNFTLPVQHRVLSMHCSANMGVEKRDTAIFFGLSGTGKTTLSADPDRLLIGDDEHGWTHNNIFNFEGGCYAKAIDLSEEKEPDIWNAIKYGAIVENTQFFKDERIIDFTDASISENTRVSYPLDHIRNTVSPSIGGIPQNIFFLTCDAFGVIPPLLKLSKPQAMYHFMSGYTSKVAGTETGVVSPEPVFSACFGSPFMPLHPSVYAELLGQKMEENKVNIWLINTGWTGGPYGIGKRIELRYTRAIITAVLTGVINNVGYRKHSIFGAEIPLNCPGVPNEILSPRETWKNDAAFYKQANELALRFQKNFEKFKENVNDDIMEGSPVPNKDYIN
jgi:phosphoenolpyruvate carboxykinase (ATP)